MCEAQLLGVEVHPTGLPSRATFRPALLSPLPTCCAPTQPSVQLLHPLLPAGPTLCLTPLPLPAGQAKTLSEEEAVKDLFANAEALGEHSLSGMAAAATAVAGKSSRSRQQQLQ